MNKAHLRSHHLSLRSSLSEVEASQLSDEITRKLLSLPEVLNANSAHVYLPVTEQREVDTWALVDGMLKSKVRVFVPVITMTAITSQEISATTRYKNDERGIPTPQGESKTNSKFDVIIVPCVCADKHRYRLGHGSGMYDKFLKAQKTTAKIGLCYEINLVDNMPHEGHDVTLDKIVTEARII